MKGLSFGPQTLTSTKGLSFGPQTLTVRTGVKGKSRFVPLHEIAINLGTKHCDIYRFVMHFQVVTQQVHFLDVEN